MKRAGEKSGRALPQNYNGLSKKIRKEELLIQTPGSSIAPTREPKTFPQKCSKPKYHDVVSHQLSEVLKHIGLNENIVRRRRRAQILEEKVNTAVNEAVGQHHSVYVFGSQSEGTTTVGMNSDRDLLNCHRKYNVIETANDWKPGLINLLMKQDDSTPPGYCRLLLLSDECPFLVDRVPNQCFETDGDGYVVLTNTLIQTDDPTLPSFERHGPSWAILRQGFRDHDYVFAIHCQSWKPESKWNYKKDAFTSMLTPELCQEDACNTGCFLVPVGSKRSNQEPVEWRISTSLIERLLMFSLNITHLHCYVLMKFIVKTFINPMCGDTISSFMCKTTLFHCVNRAPAYVWRDDNLLSCLSFCLSTLRIFILYNNCPHFVLPTNNLLAGRLTSLKKRRLLAVLNELLDDDWRFLLKVKLDDLGYNLGMKLSTIPELRHHDISTDIDRNICNYLVIDAAQFLSEIEMVILTDVSANNGDIAIYNLRCVLEKLSTLCYHGNSTERHGFKLVLTRLYTAMGSFLASRNIKQSSPISQEALDYFKQGLNSDATSGRLKLASAYFCARDFEKAEMTLADVESRYNIDLVEPFCQCFDRIRHASRPGFVEVCRRSSEEAIKMASALCVRFTESERYCVPTELQYEFFRCSSQHMFYSNTEQCEDWMKWAVVDSLPFLYFLQYQVYDRLGKGDKKDDTLMKYLNIIGKQTNLRHRETGWNLLGQLMEKDFGYLHAEKCYNASLEERPICNAANGHLKRLELRRSETKYVTCEFIPCCC